MIEVFADIWCPFAYVGLQIVRVRRDEHAPGVPIKVRAWPLELVNGEPMSVEKTAHHVRDLRAELGLDCFNGFDAERFPTTMIPALALVAAAGRQSDTLGERASFRVREELWEAGRDIGAPDVVADLAAEFAVSVTDAERQLVLDDWHEGEQRGVKGSPHFFCGDRDEFCPSLSLSRDPVGDLRVKPDPSRLEAFLDTCWSS